MKEPQKGKMSKVDVNLVNKCLFKIAYGDEKAVTVLFHALSPTLRYIARKYIPDKEQAEDLVQDFWADIEKIAKGFVRAENGFNYLVKVMNRRAINRYKKLSKEKARVRPVDFELDGRCEDFSEKYALQQMVQSALEKLEEVERIIIEESYFENKTVREIGKDLNIPKSTVARIKQKALDKLKTLLKE